MFLGLGLRLGHWLGDFFDFICLLIPGLDLVGVKMALILAVAVLAIRTAWGLHLDHPHHNFEHSVELVVRVDALSGRLCADQRVFLRHWRISNEEVLSGLLNLLQF